jgi:hypothetical protein
MTNLAIKDGTGASIFVKATGTGTNGDPIVTASDITSLPSLPAGTNAIGSVDLRVSGAAASVANPVPVLAPAPTTGTSGQTTVPTAGTFVSLGTGNLTRGVHVRGLFANTGIIRVRYTGNGTTTGFELGAGDLVWLDADNLSRIQIDATVNGNGVSYIGS